ncbi:MAG: hypothetical protein ACRDN0_25275, partial [Trebonia sp.]
MQLSKPWHEGEADGVGVPDEEDELGDVLGLVLARLLGEEPGAPAAGFPGVEEGRAEPLAVLPGCGCLRDLPALAEGVPGEAPPDGLEAEGWTTPRDAGWAVWLPPLLPCGPPPAASSPPVTPAAASSTRPDAMAARRRPAAPSPVSRPA